MPAADDERRRWHVDKTVPVALLVGMSLQTIGIVWWVATSIATSSARLDQLERQATAAAPQAERLIRVEEKLGAVQAALAEIKAALTPAPRR